MGNALLRSRVDRELDEVVRRASLAQAPVDPRAEAERIVDELTEQDPTALVEYLRRHAVSLLSQALRLRLSRTRSSRSVFSKPPEENQTATEERRSPFERYYPAADHQYVPLGDMKRPDWYWLMSRQRTLAMGNLFRAEFAKLVIARLPDDETRTRDVLSETEIVTLQVEAHLNAQRVIPPETPPTVHLPDHS